MKKIDNTVVGNLDIIKDGYIFDKPSLLKIQNGKIEVEEE